MNNTVSDFEPWDNVRYVPDHAIGNPGHVDGQNGIVHHINGDLVFVRYIKNNICGVTAAATRPENLMKGHW